MVWKQSGRVWMAVIALNMSLHLFVPFLLASATFDKLSTISFLIQVKALVSNKCSKTVKFLHLSYCPQPEQSTQQAFILMNYSSNLAWRLNKCQNFVVQRFEALGSTSFSNFQQLDHVLQLGQIQLSFISYLSRGSCAIL